MPLRPANNSNSRDGPVSEGSTGKTSNTVYKLCRECSQVSEGHIIYNRRDEFSIFLTQLKYHLTHLQDFRQSADIYIHEYLDQEALFTLQANQEKVSKADLNGDLLIYIFTILYFKPLPEQAQLLKASKTKVWLMQAFRCGNNQFIRQLLQVIHV